MKRMLKILALTLLPLACLAPTPCPAQVQTCGPGVDCRANSFQTTGNGAYSAFPRCRASLVGQLRYNGDAGAYYLCQSDGGWGSLGGGDAVWRFNDATHLAPTIAPPYTIVGNGPPTSPATSLTFSDDDYVQLKAGALGGDFIAQDPSSTENIGLLTVLPYDGVALNAQSDTYSPMSLQLKTGPAGQRGLILNNTAAVSGLLEGTFWYDGGATLTAGATYTQVVTLTGAGQITDHDICVMEQPPGGTSASVITTCGSVDGNQVRLNWYNHSASSVNLTCSFASAICGRRVRMIQRH